jgi:hypothetical protein
MSLFKSRRSLFWWSLPFIGVIVAAFLINGFPGQPTKRAKTRLAKAKLARAAPLTAPAECSLRSIQVDYFGILTPELSASGGKCWVDLANGRFTVIGRNPNGLVYFRYEAPSPKTTGTEAPNPYMKPACPLPSEIAILYDTLCQLPDKESTPRCQDKLIFLIGEANSYR